MTYLLGASKNPAVARDVSSALIRAGGCPRAACLETLSSVFSVRFIPYAARELILYSPSAERFAVGGFILYVDGFDVYDVCADVYYTAKGKKYASWENPVVVPYPVAFFRELFGRLWVEPKYLS